MLIKTSRKIEIIILSTLIISIYALEYIFNYKLGVRINFNNFIIGIISSFFAFLLFNSFIFFIALFRAKKIKQELEIIEILNSNFDILTKAIFISTVEQLIVVTIIFDAIYKSTNIFIAYLIAASLSYALHFKKDKINLTISYSFICVFFCFLYQIHHSYFLNFTSSSFFWIFWLSYVKSGYFKRNFLEVLNIKNRLLKRYIK